MSPELLDRIEKEAVLDAFNPCGQTPAGYEEPCQCTRISLLTGLGHTYFACVECHSPRMPEVGMGATGGYGSDRYPYTVVKVSTSGLTVELRADNYAVTGEQAVFFPNEKARPITARFSIKGGWRSPGGTRFALGHRSYHQDPHK